MVGAAVDPAQLPAQLGEDAMHLAVAQGPAQQSSPAADEERASSSRESPARSRCRAVASQGVHRARMQRHLTGLAELGLADRQHAGLEIDIGDRSATAPRRCADRVEAISPNSVSKTTPRRPPAGPSARAAASSVDDLLLAVDVRRHALGHASEDRVVGHFGGGLELLQPAHEGAQLLQPPCPVSGSALPCLSRRAHSAITSSVSGSAMARALHDGSAKLRKAAGIAAQLRSPERGVRPGSARHAPAGHAGAAHAALPGHGRATSARLRLSSLA